MVSELCLGAMTFGRELNEEGSREIISRFLEVGGNFIDTPTSTILVCRRR
jgi:aryl-alcohol dehydrogenase-like predicted oxidoreductase